MLEGAKCCFESWNEVRGINGAEYLLNCACVSKSKRLVALLVLRFGIHVTEMGIVKVMRIESRHYLLLSTFRLLYIK